MTEPGVVSGSKPAELPIALTALKRFAVNRRPARCANCAERSWPTSISICLKCPAGACAAPATPVPCCFRAMRAHGFAGCRGDTVRLHDFVLDDCALGRVAAADRVGVPLRNRRAGEVVAVYPSPAGGTQSQVDAESWQELVRANPLLGQLEPEVETLLVNRVGPRASTIRRRSTSAFAWWA